MSSDEGGLSPDEAFRLLGDGTRLAILRAVWDSEEPVSFSAIRERVGRPDSGQFNYHINRLRGPFLSKRDGGYRLTQAGREVVRAVLAGTITQRPETGPEPIDAPCAECGGRLAVRYDEYATVECADCGATSMWNEFPPAGLDGRTPEEVATAFDRWTQHRFRLAMDGICPSCAAGTTTTLVAPGVDGGDGDDRGDRSDGVPTTATDDAGSTGTHDGPTTAHDDSTTAHDDPTDDGSAAVTVVRADAVATEHRCGNCRYEARVPLAGHVLRHPAAIGFYAEAGVDVTAMPYWEIQGLARAFEVAVVSEDPWRVAVAIDADGRSLALLLDDRLDVREVDRSDR